MCCSGLEALKERFLRHVQPAPQSKGERSLHVNVVRKESTASGQEELRAESITVTVNEEEEKSVPTKPGIFVADNFCSYLKRIAVLQCNFISLYYICRL